MERKEVVVGAEAARASLEMFAPAFKPSNLQSFKTFIWRQL